MEPGLLATFRTYTFILWLVYALGLFEPSPTNLIGFCLTTCQLIYLNLRGLQHQRWYLPLGIGIATLGPILIYRALGAEYWQDDGVLVILLMVPLIIVSTQYAMRVMVAFIIGTVLLEGLLVAFQPDVIGMAFARSFLFALVGYAIVRLMTAQRAQRARLMQLATTQEQLIVTQERNRMARELHDTLAHTLSAVSVQLKALAVTLERDPDSSCDILHTLQRLTQDGLTETRQALHALRSNPIDDLGLTLALKNLAQATAERAGAALHLTITERQVTLTHHQQQHVYRIAEEALNNVVRHANAANLTVIFDFQPPFWVLEIMDDGVGFSPDAPQPDGHYGIIGMRERAVLCGGELSITSGQGTHIQLKLKG